MKFHEALARSLADHEIDTIFGVLGDANLFAMHSFVSKHGGRYCPVNHEGTAVLAAAGYARSSGKLGVATVTHGPALTNASTALVEASRERAPVLVIAGEVATSNRDHSQRIAQREFITACEAGYELLRSPNTLAEDLAMAIRRAHAERTTIVFLVPADFTWVDVDYVRSYPRSIQHQALHPDREAMENAAAIVASSRRPLILAGRGACSSRSKALLVRLADRLGAPLATSLRARELFHGEACNLGVFGTLSHEVALDVIQSSDCVIAFGASLNQLTTDMGSLVADRRIVQVDSDHAALGRWVRVDAAVHGDSETVAAELLDVLDELDLPSTNFANSELADRLAARPRVDSGNDSDCLTIEQAVRALDHALPGDRTLVLDGGRFAFSCYTSLSVPEPGAYLHTLNFGSIGLGMGTAIGAALGRPDRRTVLVAGDGGFMMGGLTEFSTAVQLGTDMIVVVLSDGGYGAEHVQYRARGLDPSMAGVAWPDLGPVARSLGGAGYTVRTMSGLNDALARIADRTQPLLVEIKLDPDEIPMLGH